MELIYAEVNLVLLTTCAFMAIRSGIRVNHALAAHRALLWREQGEAFLRERAPLFDRVIHDLGLGVCLVQIV